jgi:putative copper resistance protein D
LVRIQLPELVRSEYGWLVIGKFVALCLLGLIGWRQRRSGLAALKTDPEARGPLIRLALVEAAVFGATFGIAVGLGRTPPPPLHTEPSPVEVAIGYGFDGPPTVARL